MGVCAQTLVGPMEMQRRIHQELNRQRTAAERRGIPLCCIAVAEQVRLYLPAEGVATDESGHTVQHSPYLFGLPILTLKEPPHGGYMRVIPTYEFCFSWLPKGVLRYRQEDPAAYRTHAFIEADAYEGYLCSAAFRLWDRYEQWLYQYSALCRLLRKRADIHKKAEQYALPLFMEELESVLFDLDG